MDGLKGLSRAVDALSEGAGKVAEWLVLAACLVSATNAVVRYLFSYSSNGFLEVQWYMFGALVFLGAAHTLRMNEHVRVDLVYASVSERTQVWIDILGFVVFFLPVVGYLAYLSWPFFLQSWRSGEASNNAGGLILWPAKAILPLGFGLLFLQGVAELIKRVLVLHGDMRLEAKYEKPVQ